MNLEVSCETSREAATKEYFTTLGSFYLFKYYFVDKIIKNRFLIEKKIYILHINAYAKFVLSNWYIFFEFLSSAEISYFLYSKFEKKYNNRFENLYLI